MKDISYPKKISIISATYNRAELLQRALLTYSKQTMPREDWEYLIVDDGSVDNTRELINVWYQYHLPVRCFDATADLNMPKTPGSWRDGCALRNAASRHARGEVLIFTHPEIMVPPKALEVAYEAVSTIPDCWATAIPYWLPEADYDSVDWQSNLRALNRLPGFYDPSWPDEWQTPGAPDYRNQNQESRDDWNSEVWFAMHRDLWFWSGGFREFKQWGSVDMDFWARRRALQIPTLVLPGQPKHLMVYHQFHGSPRDLDLAMEGAKGADYSTPFRTARQGGLWNK